MNILYRYGNKINFKYRQEPVPHIHKPKNYRYFRKFSTKQEKSFAYLCESEGIKVRGKRKGKNLIDSWEDIKRCKQRNWKKFRMTRWK